MTDPSVTSPLSSLVKITDEIASGVSIDEIQLISYAGITKGMLTYVSEKCNKSIRTALDDFNVEHKLNEKFQHLKHLEETSSKSKAWRPVTGQAADITSLKAKYLRLKRAKLIEELETLRAQTSECSDLKLKRTMFSKQLKEIDSLSSK